MSSSSDDSEDDIFKKRRAGKPKATDLHHRWVFSLLKNSKEGGREQPYPVLMRRVRVPATFRVYEAWEKKMGKMYFVKRNIHVASYEYLDVTFGDRTRTWGAKIRYDEHNLDRLRAARDDTWEEDEFLDTVQRSVQFPKTREGVSYLLTEAPDDTPPPAAAGADADASADADGNGDAGHKEEKKSEKQSPQLKKSQPAAAAAAAVGGGQTKLLLEIREKSDGITTSYTKPVSLTKSNDNTLPNDAFLSKIYALNLDRFCRLVRTNKLLRAKEMIAEGFTDPTSFAGEDEGGWCPLHWAAHSGHLEMLLWLLDDLHVPPQSRSKNGWTAFHLACMQGRFEAAKELYSRGCSLHDSTTSGPDGRTPLSLAMEQRHSDLLRFFLGEESTYAQGLYKAHGVRPTLMPPDMYLTLKPLPPEVMKEVLKQRKKKLKVIAAKMAEAKEDADRAARLAAGIPEPAARFTKTGGTSSRPNTSTKGGGGGGKGTPSPSPSPSRGGGGGKRDASPSTKPGSVGNSPSPSKRK